MGAEARQKNESVRRMREAIAEHAVRWANNILVEVQGNHGGVLSDERRKCLRTAVNALADFDGKD